MIEEHEGQSPGTPLLDHHCRRPTGALTAAPSSTLCFRWRTVTTCRRRDEGPPGGLHDGQPPASQLPPPPPGGLWRGGSGCDELAQPGTRLSSDALPTIVRTRPVRVPDSHGTKCARPFGWLHRRIYPPGPSLPRPARGEGTPRAPAHAKAARRDARTTSSRDERRDHLTGTTTVRQAPVDVERDGRYRPTQGVIR